MSDCSRNCDSCKETCSSRTTPQSLLESQNRNSHVKHVIAVVSGKGGVGKSLVTSMMATLAQRQGYQTAVLDADITGPSIPRMFGVKGRIYSSEEGIYPAKSQTGIELMSVNLLLQNETDPVVWRGPIIAGTVKQFWSDVIWGEVDYMFVDMPPGTGDVPLTVFQSLPVSGIIVVTSPQDLVSMIVGKAVKMARMMNVPVLGIVENMSYFVCPDCGKKHTIYGVSHVEETAKEAGIPHVAKLPIDPQIAQLCDMGMIEMVDGSDLIDFAKAILNS